MYVLRCTTIGLKQECGHKISRRADMNFRFKPTAKIGQFFVPTSQKMRLCVDVIWRHSFSYVVLPIDVYMSSGLYQYKSSYWHHTFSDLSHWAEIYLVGDDRRTVNTSTVRTFLISWGQKTRVKYCYVDLSSWYEIWFAIICNNMNVILDLPTAIQHF